MLNEERQNRSDYGPSTSIVLAIGTTGISTSGYPILTTSLLHLLNSTPDSPIYSYPTPFQPPPPFSSTTLVTTPLRPPSSLHLSLFIFICSPIFLSISLIPSPLSLNQISPLLLQHISLSHLPLHSTFIHLLSIYPIFFLSSTDLLILSFLNNILFTSIPARLIYAHPPALECP